MPAADLNLTARWVSDRCVSERDGEGRGGGGSDYCPRPHATEQDASSGGRSRASLRKATEACQRARLDIHRSSAACCESRPCGRDGFGNGRTESMQKQGHLSCLVSLEGGEPLHTTREGQLGLLENNSTKTHRPDPPAPLLWPPTGFGREKADRQDAPPEQSRWAATRWIRPLPG